MTLVTNFFKVTLPSSVGVFAYHVAYEQPVITDDKLSRSKAWRIFNNLKEQADLGSRPMFDGKHTLFLFKDIGEQQTVIVNLGRKENPNKKTQQLLLKKTNLLKLYGFDLTPESTRVLEAFIATLFPDLERRGKGFYNMKDERNDVKLNNSDLIIKTGMVSLTTVRSFWIDFFCVRNLFYFSIM